MDIGREKTQEEFLNQMLGALNNVEDKSFNSFSYDILSAVAIIFQEGQRKINNLFLMFDVNNLEGEALEQRVLQVAGVQRKKPTLASGQVLVTGNPGTVIPKGSIFKAGDIEFVSLAEATITSDGLVSLEVEALVPGVTGDVVPRAISKIEPAISGVTDVYNPKGFTNGYEAELDDDLRERYYERLLHPPKGGNPAHYKLWATEVDGIWDARVFRTAKGPGTVKVVLVGLDRKVVGDELISKVKDHILAEAPIRYENLEVMSAKAKAINVKVSLSLEDGRSKDLVKEELKKNIERYLNLVTFRQDFVSLAKIGGQILETPGVVDYENLTINSSQANVELARDEIPQLTSLEVI